MSMSESVDQLLTVAVEDEVAAAADSQKIQKRVRRPSWTRIIRRSFILLSVTKARKMQTTKDVTPTNIYRWGVGYI